jgi:2-oxoglutarate/2-oxoacid ferredoxin oxidoreductase subunit beta
MQAKEIVKAAILHRGYALVDIFQSCIVFNKQNTYQWFKEHTYYLDETHDASDKMAAFHIALETEKLPLGIIYQETGKPTYEELVRQGNEPLFMRRPDKAAFDEVVVSYR